MGWTLVAVLEWEGTDWQVKRKHVWGLDLSGTMTGAGGVGGMLWSEGAEGSIACTYDGNGNVTGLVDLASGVAVGGYRYSPFGEVLERWGSATAKQNFTFSTKWQDPVTGFHDYGYRWYDAESGRWLSRDPIGEDGAVNLYGMVGNDAVNGVDHLGLITVRTRAKEPGECGAYTVGFDFSLDQPATTDGYMIQEVRWTLKLRKAGGGFETTSGTFYESWPINKGTGMTNWRGPVQSGNTVVQSTDISGRKGGECTEGSYEAKGTIRFHSVGTTGLMPNSPGRPPADIPGPWAPNTGFSIGGVPQAGTLPSSPDQPPWWNNPSPNAEKEGSRRVFAEWNCVPPIAGSGRQTKLTVTP